jgi:hypothetical protein
MMAPLPNSNWMNPFAELSIMSPCLILIPSAPWNVVVPRMTRRDPSSKVTDPISCPAGGRGKANNSKAKTSVFMLVPLGPSCQPFVAAASQHAELEESDKLIASIRELGLLGIAPSSAPVLRITGTLATRLAWRLEKASHHSGTRSNA